MEKDKDLLRDTEPSPDNQGHTDKYKWDGEPDEISQQVNRLKAEKDVDKQAEYFVRAHEYCANKEVVASMLPEVLRNAIGKYGIDYRSKLPEFYKVYQEIGA